MQALRCFCIAGVPCLPLFIGVLHDKHFLTPVRSPVTYCTRKCLCISTTRDLHFNLYSSHMLWNTKRNNIECVSWRWRFYRSFTRFSGIQEFELELNRWELEMTPGIVIRADNTVSCKEKAPNKNNLQTTHTNHYPSRPVTGSNKLRIISEVKPNCCDGLAE